MNSFSYNEQENESDDKVLINVGGVKFETYVATLQNIADTRLTWLTENIDPDILKRKEFFFDRHPGAFVHILNYYRTGKLHTPTDICGPLFEEELQFWGVDEKQMEPCCWESFTKHREAEENLKSFVGPGFEDLKNENNRKVSTASRVFMQDEKYGNCSFFNTKNIWRIIDEPHSSTHAKRFSLLSCLMIIISVSVYCINTMPILQRYSIWNYTASWIDRLCLTFFTLEFSLRILCTPDKKHFIRDYHNWIDFLSVVPSYMKLIFPYIPWIKHLVIIRVLRVFKFFKLSYGLQVLLHTLKGSLHELTLLSLILLIPVVLFSSLIYVLEFGIYENIKFNSIPRSFWWCIITMTTVGYGDLAPETWAGQIIGSVCAISGLLIIALPISVIGSNFTLYYAHARARLKLPKKNRALLQGNLRGLLRQPLSLSSRDRDRRSLRRNLNNEIRNKMENPSSPTSIQYQLSRRQAFDQVSYHTQDTESVLESEIDARENGNRRVSLRSNLLQNTPTESKETTPEPCSEKNVELDNNIFEHNSHVTREDSSMLCETNETQLNETTNPLIEDLTTPIGNQLRIVYNGISIMSDMFKVPEHTESDSLNSLTSHVESPKHLTKLMRRNKCIETNFLNKSTPRISRRGALAIQNSIDSSEESDCEYVFSPVMEAAKQNPYERVPLLVVPKEMNVRKIGNEQNSCLSCSSIDLSLEKDRRISMQHLSCFENMIKTDKRDASERFNSTLIHSNGFNKTTGKENLYARNITVINPKTERNTRMSSLTENTLNFFTSRNKPKPYDSIVQINENNNPSEVRLDHLLSDKKHNTSLYTRHKSEGEIRGLKPSLVKQCHLVNKHLNKSVTVKESGV